MTTRFFAGPDGWFNLKIEDAPDAGPGWWNGSEWADPPAGFVEVPGQPDDPRATWQSGAWVSPPPVTTAPSSTITATAFLDRLGADGPALMASPFGFALVRLAAAGTIRLDDPDVVAGMQAAVDVGAISTERATALLAP